MPTMSTPHLIPMPANGLFRVERWTDLHTFPPPAEPSMLSRKPVLDGYRWEDLFGQFATAKFSESEIAAVGRSIANFRERCVPDPDVPHAGTKLSIFNAIKRFSSEEPDDGPELEPGNRIPPVWFDDASQMRIDHVPEIWFVDVEHADTRATLAQEDGTLFLLFGLPDVPADLSSSRDRRVTRLVTSLLHQWCARTPGFEAVAGLRYRAHDPGWDGYVLWEPSRLRYDIAEDAPLGPCDNAVRAAAAHLGLDDPCV
jgi:hypothetical protein